MSSLEKINEVFADSVYLKYKTTRYGIKKCSTAIGEDLAYDLKNLYERSIQKSKCGESSISTGCGIVTLDEKIKSL